MGTRSDKPRGNSYGIRIVSLNARCPHDGCHIGTIHIGCIMERCIAFVLQGTNVEQIKQQLGHLRALAFRFGAHMHTDSFFPPYLSPADDITPACVAQAEEVFL